MALTLGALPMSADVPPGAADPLASLVERVRAGELRAFDALYTRTRDQVHRTLYRLVGSNADMEDLVQQVYLQLLSAIRSFRGESRFSTFLYRVCANVALMHLRSRHRRPEDLTDEMPEEAAGASDDPERRAQVRQAAALLQRALDELAPKKRVVFVYHELMGLMPEEIAEAVDASPNTVRSRLHHARLELSAVIARLTRESPARAREVQPELLVARSAERSSGGGHGA